MNNELKQKIKDYIIGFVGYIILTLVGIVIFAIFLVGFQQLFD